MSSLVSLKTRLSSVSSTQKVIKAMDLVASSKIKKAREKAQGVAVFSEVLEQSINDMSSYYAYDKILKRKDNGVNLYIVISSDLGLCGAYNLNVAKRFEAEVKEDKDYEIITLGSKGAKKLEYAGFNIYKKIVDFEKQDEYELAKSITDEIIGKWNDDEIKDIKIVYTEFVNPLVQEARVLDVFSQEALKEEQNKRDILIEPSPEEVFPKLFEQYIRGLVYACILKSLASEHSHRRNSMDAANKNSLELIDKLGLDINRIRQTMITQEISEIIGGSEASKKE